MKKLRVKELTIKENLSLNRLKIKLTPGIFVYFGIIKKYVGTDKFNKIPEPVSGVLGTCLV